MIPDISLTVDDGQLHLIAEISATLLGLFLVGVFFYAESRRRRRTSAAFERYLRSGTRITLLLYAIPLVEAFALLLAGPRVAAVLFAASSLLLIVANVDTIVGLLRLPRDSRSSALSANEIASTVIVIALVSLPWALGGLVPTRAHLALGALLALAAAFLSTCALILSVFDTPAQTEEHGERRPIRAHRAGRRSR